MNNRKRLLLVLVALVLLALAGTGWAADRDPFVEPSLTNPVVTVLRVGGTDIPVQKIIMPENAFAEVVAEKVVIVRGKIGALYCVDGLGEECIVGLDKAYMQKDGTWLFSEQDITCAVSLRPGTIKKNGLKPGMPARLVFKNR